MAEGSSPKLPAGRGKANEKPGNWSALLVRNGPDDPTHVAVGHDLGETDLNNGAVVLESPDDARLDRAVRCVNFLAGVSDAVLAGSGIDGTLLGLLKGLLADPAGVGRRCALADHILERAADPVP